MTWSIDKIPAFCITLERRGDRWKRFQDQPGIRGLPLKRFLGVDGKTIDLLSDKRIATFTKRNIHTKQRRSHEELDSIGGVGCALSHAAVWTWMVENQQPLCLIFEDDAVVPPDFIQKANQILQQSEVLQHPTQWEIWLLGGIWDDLSSIPHEPSSSSVIRVGSFVLYHAYVMTLPCAKRLLQDVYPIHGHIDIWTSVYAYLHDLRLVGSTELRLQQSQRVKTDIQSDEGCMICNVPTDYDKDSVLVKKGDLLVARSAEVILFALLCYYGYQRFMK